MCQQTQLPISLLDLRIRHILLQPQYLVESRSGALPYSYHHCLLLDCVFAILIPLIMISTSCCIAIWCCIGAGSRCGGHLHQVDCLCRWSLPLGEGVLGWGASRSIVSTKCLALAKDNTRCGQYSSLCTANFRCSALESNPRLALAQKADLPQDSWRRSTILVLSFALVL